MRGRCLPDEPFLTVALRHQIGRLALEVAFELRQPWTILFGPSGSGKTTILRVLAGLVTPLSGMIAARDSGTTTTLLDTGAAVNVAAYMRRMPWAPQASSLFPHLTVAGNLEYGGGRREPEMEEAFELRGLLGKYPSQLSGGEAQRVNLARAAMCPQPRLLLLDEPFTGLDLRLRSSLVGHLLEWQRRTRVPILSVTHDVVEAFQVGAEVIRLAEGRVAVQGAAVEVLGNERGQLLSQLQPSGSRPTPTP